MHTPISANPVRRLTTPSTPSQLKQLRQQLATTQRLLDSRGRGDFVT